ncbi:hypothetical protein R1sor_023286 [Riccia sorocarpa]|uniref:Uncharacterized protein n=1 Tax=Riccia sorocarpa TaxID=122646 RepID=A0ABD3GQF5_9MARC
MTTHLPLKQAIGAPVPRFASRLLVVRCNAAGGASSSAPSSPPTKLVTFIGKGGVGKTTCAVLAAQYYASKGLRTCLAVQSQDPTAEFLLGEKLGTYSAPLKAGNLSAFRLESTKLLAEPWSQLKSADAELKFSQGALDEVVSEELSILPGMDSFLAIGLLDSLSNFTGNLVKSRSRSTEQYDVVVYDGPSSEETLRIIGAPERTRWYLRRLRSLADKTDAGRVTLPSIMKGIESSILERGPSDRSTPEIWNFIDSIFTKIVDLFSDPTRFGCYIVTDFRNQLASDSALRYWGCAVQAGVSVSGAFYTATPDNPDLDDAVRENYGPLPIGEVPLLSFRSAPDWERVLSDFEAGDILDGMQPFPTPPGVAFDKAARTVTLFLPGFAKSEIKLSQWRGGSELLVDVGDQRRSIVLPSDMRGKVAGAKFQNKSLVVTIKGS